MSYKTSHHKKLLSMNLSPTFETFSWSSFHSKGTCLSCLKTTTKRSYLKVVMSGPWKFRNEKGQINHQSIFSLIWLSWTNLSSFTHGFHFFFFPGSVPDPLSQQLFAVLPPAKRLVISIIFERSPVLVVISRLKIDFLESQYLRVEDHFSHSSWSTLELRCISEMIPTSMAIWWGSQFVVSQWKIRKNQIKQNHQSNPCGFLPTSLIADQTVIVLS